LHLKARIYELNLRASGLWFYFSILDLLYFLFRVVHSVLGVNAISLLLPRLKTDVKERNVSLSQLYIYNDKFYIYIYIYRFDRLTFPVFYI
jgi:hypothetical protein